MEKDKLDALLQKYFGYNSLKDEQYKIINNVLDGKDVCAILPTGFGKSICYQMPFLATNKNVIVVSPLIALMEDQVRQLKEKNIPVVALNSNNNGKDISILEIYKGEYKIIYTTPEYLAKNNKFIAKMAKMDILAMVAVDESHCASNWGNDFRPDYQKLSCIREYAPNVPILALTATATKHIQDDICKILQLKDPIFITGNFDRPNLYLSVDMKQSDTFDTKIKSLLEKFKESKILIYCKTKDDTDKLAEEINKLGIKADSYHAGKSNEARNKCQEKFTKGEINCIVATIAFGMGINIPDIRLVIHYGSPSDLESYYQEIGRAGRDGNKSECHMFYSNKDFYISRLFTGDIKNPQFKKYKEKELEYMQKYIHTKICRRHILLKHFDNTSDVRNCEMCDICTYHKKNLQDHTGLAIKILSLVYSYNRSMGVGSFIKILRGSNEKKLDKIRKKVPTYFGLGKDKKEDWWKLFFNQLKANDYITEKTLAGSKFAAVSVIEITKKGIDTIIFAEENEVIPDKYKILLDMPDDAKVTEKSSIITNPFDHFDDFDKFNDSAAETIKKPKKEKKCN